MGRPELPVMGNCAGCSCARTAGSPARMRPHRCHLQVCVCVAGAGRSNGIVDLRVYGFAARDARTAFETAQAAGMPTSRFAESISTHRCGVKGVPNVVSSLWGRATGSGAGPLNSLPPPWPLLASAFLPSVPTARVVPEEHQRLYSGGVAHSLARVALYEFRHVLWLFRWRPAPFPVRQLWILDIILILTYCVSARRPLLPLCVCVCVLQASSARGATYLCQLARAQTLPCMTHPTGR